MPGSRADRLALLFCLVFIGLGSLWISEVGLQADEALFATAIYPPYTSEIHLFGKPRPLMLMPYLGALKSYIWKPVVRNLRPTVAAVRIPAVLLAGLTIWWFYLLVKRTAGVRTALTSAALLSTDATYILTSRWDWGPVVLQHLFAVGGALSIVRFKETRRLGWLALGFLAFGLGAWDKALFFWTFSGLGVAAVAVFPRAVWAELNARTITVAAAALVLGASPVIAYNVVHPLATFGHSRWSWHEDVPGKAVALLKTLSGGGLLGSVVREDRDGPVRTLDDPIKRAWVAATDRSGAPRTNLYAYLAGLALLLAPLTWQSHRARRAFLFADVYCLAAWLQMAFTVEAGGSPHHSALIWPFPHLAVAAVLAGVSRRMGRAGVPALVAVTLAACLSSVALLGTYYTNMLRNGGAKEWTDAIYPAAAALPAMQPSFVCLLDWGFQGNTRLLTRGRVNLCEAIDPAANVEAARAQMRVPGVVYMTHTSANRVYPELTARFLAQAASDGYRKTDERTFYDYNGRAIIEVFKLSSRN